MFTPKAYISLFLFQGCSLLLKQFSKLSYLVSKANVTYKVLIRWGTVWLED